MHRTSLMLDSETQQAARELALRHGCSMSEAIRRAILRHHDTMFGLPAQSRAERRRVLDRLFELFEGHDAEDEVHRLKAQDEGF